MLLDRFQLAEAAAEGDPEASIAPIMINSDPDISHRSPYEFIYARYDRGPRLQVRCNPPWASRLEFPNMSYATVALVLKSTTFVFVTADLAYVLCT